MRDEGGRGGGAVICFLFVCFFPVQHATRSGIGHRVKSFVLVGKQYAECEKQQQQQQQLELNNNRSIP